MKLLITSTNKMLQEVCTGESFWGYVYHIPLSGARPPRGIPFGFDSETFGTQEHYITLYAKLLIIEKDETS